MTTSTTNLGLDTYNSTTDLEETVLQYLEKTSGISSSNMTKIDDFVGKILSLGGSMPGRLSASSTLAIPTTDITGSTTLYYLLTGDKGKFGSLYDGTKWIATDLSNVSGLSLSGLVANTVYDVFMYLNGGVPTLETLAWASSKAGTSTRATALALQDGRTVKSGDATRLYLGAILIDAAGGAVSSSIARRGVCNIYNRIWYHARTFNSNASWTLASGGSTEELNAGAGQTRGEFVVCNVQSARLAAVSARAIGTFSDASIAITLNGTSTQLHRYQMTNANIVAIHQNNANLIIPAGYNYVTQTQIPPSSGTATVFGTNNRSSGILLEM